MQALFQDREFRDIERLASVVELAEEEGCIVRRLLEYFGEVLEADCGNCSRCRGEQVGSGPLPRSAPVEIGGEDVELVHQVAGENHAALRTPRQLARFLCGISSPAASRAGLGKHDAFACLEQVAFQDVLALAESLNRG